ncbi:hypothetical protein E0I61_15065 [Flavobacterium ranwuense]|uniref:Uncharacterized protein n=2 Tax=Flavobacterium ranwuense TaxID=2541725 RepID=A0ABY2DMY8_9FLAO|nr:hypothetical protein E0I61_15065 [Flavobacterium ranwuense]
MSDNNLEVGSVLSFLTVYLLFIIHFVNGFKKLKFNKTDVLSILSVILVMLILSIAILSLQFEKMKTDFLIIIIYSMILGILICISVVNHITKAIMLF